MKLIRVLVIVLMVFASLVEAASFNSFNGRLTIPNDTITENGNDDKSI